MRRVDAISMAIDGHRADGDGRLVIEGRLARTGWQEYPTGREYRDASEVFSPASLATYAGAPVTVGHVWIEPSNVARDAVGYVRSVRRDGDHVRGTVVLFARRAIDAVRDGRLAEWSMGYTVDTVDRNGELWQTKIRINHAAILPPGAARCGSSCAVL